MALAQTSVHVAPRIGRPPLPDDELMATIKAVVAALPTYDYRRAHVILKRQALAAGHKSLNHKQVYPVTKDEGPRSLAQSPCRRCRAAT